MLSRVVNPPISNRLNKTRLDIAFSTKKMCLTFEISACFGTYFERICIHAYVSYADEVTHRLPLCEHFWRIVAHVIDIRTLIWFQVYLLVSREIWASFYIGLARNEHSLIAVARNEYILIGVARNEHSLIEVASPERAQLDCRGQERAQLDCSDQERAQPAIP